MKYNWDIMNIQRIHFDGLSPLLHDHLRYKLGRGRLTNDEILGGYAENFLRTWQWRHDSCLAGADGGAPELASIMDRVFGVPDSRLRVSDYQRWYEFIYRRPTIPSVSEFLSYIEEADAGYIAREGESIVMFRFWQNDWNEFLHPNNAVLRECVRLAGWNGRRDGQYIYLRAPVA